MKTKIVSDRLNGSGTKVITEDGTEIRGITRIDFAPIVANSINTASLTLSFWSLDITAEANFVLVDPRDGKPRRVRSVQFADGDSLDFEAAYTAASLDNPRSEISPGDD